ncbi:MAG: hypothetical protein ABMB14_12140 [Myxococcota bacterium]
MRGSFGGFVEGWMFAVLGLAAAGGAVHALASSGSAPEDPVAEVAQVAVIDAPVVAVERSAAPILSVAALEPMGIPDPVAPPPIEEAPPAPPVRTTRPAPAEVADPRLVVAEIAAEAAPHPRHRPTPRKTCTEAPNPGIVPVGERTWRVDPSVVHRYTRDWSTLDELGWSLRHRGPDGKADGIEVGGFRCGSDPWDAGFRSGDVIRAVNGRSVRSVPQALLVYAAIHGDTRFDVELTRNGRPMTLRFRLDG